MSEPLANRPLGLPHAARLSPADPDYQLILDAHAAALHAGAISYIDPRSGFSVLTAGFLAARGTCCESGCRHCPYVL